MNPIQAIRRRARAWARRRQGVDPASLTLASRRIYILPTGQGLAYCALLFVMLLGAMNYNNSLGLAVTFGLTGFGLVVMHHCHRSLAGLVIDCGNADPVFAGQRARFPVTLYNPGRNPRRDIAVFYANELAGFTDLEPGERRTLTVEVPSTRRGSLSLDRFSVRSRYPAGLFETWAWIYCDLNCIVFPAPAENAPLPESAAAVTGSRTDLPRGDTDFAGLREYHRGDSPRHIAWKAYARNEELRVKQFAGADEAPRRFEWVSTSGDTEQRLSQLCRWIVDADARRQEFGLTLPALELPPASNPRHVRTCLTALAQFS